MPLQPNAGFLQDEKGDIAGIVAKFNGFVKNYVNMMQDLMQNTCSEAELLIILLIHSFVADKQQFVYILWFFNNNTLIIIDKSVENLFITPLIYC